MIKQKAAWNLHAGETKKECAGQRTQSLGPDRKIAHQIKTDGDVGGAKEMARHIGSGKRQDDDQTESRMESACWRNQKRMRRSAHPEPRARSKDRASDQDRW